MRSELSGDVLTVLVSGEVDMSTAGAMYDAANRPDARFVTLDLRAVSFFDSAAIHALIRLADRFPEGMRVVPSTTVRRVLEISGLADQPWLAEA